MSGFVSIGYRMMRRRFLKKNGKTVCGFSVPTPSLYSLIRNARSLAVSLTRHWSIAKKLNTAQTVILTVLLFITTTVLTYWLSDLLENRNIRHIQQSNQQAIDAIDTYNNALKHFADKLGNVLVGSFPAGLSVENAPRTDEALLKSGPQVLNGNNELLDRFTATTGAVASLFVRQGDRFIRVSTSIQQPNGERPIGGVLDPSQPPYAALLRGEVFTGKVKLFGRDYMTRYIPQRDKSGQVIAAAFVGLDFTTELTDLKQKLKSITLGKTGYLFALDAGKERGLATLHPTREGQNLLAETDTEGHAFIRTLLEQKNGQLQYTQRDTDHSTQERLAVFNYYPEWDWVLVASCPTEELSEEAHAVRIRLTLAGLLLSAIISLITSRTLSTWVSRPLDKVVQAMQQIAKGNLAVQIPNHKARDEVGLLLTATQQMSDSMAEAIAGIQGASRQLTSSAKKLSNSSGEVATQSSQQSEAAGHMAASIEELEGSIRHVRDCAADANRLTEQAGQVSQEGAQIIDQAVKSMGQIALTVRQAATSVTQLGHQSAAIAEIVSTIKGIADQTNLLALNAAIEAARAGEAGRGFAVVADEVKKLAQSTSVSTQEIEGMIRNILDETQSAVASIETGVTQVEQGVALAGRAGTSILAIREQAEEVSKAVAGIELALSAQSASSAELSQNVVHIAQTADANAQMAQTSAQQADGLEELSQCLSQQMSRFTLGERVIFSAMS